jgi:hypothetical protein
MCRRCSELRRAAGIFAVGAIDKLLAFERWLRPAPKPGATLRTRIDGRTGELVYEAVER